MKPTLLCLVASLGLVNMAIAQKGEIRGVVTDAATQQPLVGVNVIVRDTNNGAATDAAGSYFIASLPVGAYSLVFSMIGYEQRVVTDVLVKSNKTTLVSARLREQILASGQEVVVTAASYFAKEDDAPASLYSLNYEEVRRSPGTREDVSRMIQNLPGVSATTDDRNDLVIRGGSPSEVLFLIDNIEIPNPNHFGTQGATGGPISMVNNEFIESVNFMAGGFPAKFGNKLSGVLDIKFREPSDRSTSGKIDLNFAGAGGNLEGALKNERGSWLLAVHRSYLDFMESVLALGGVPIYSNFQGKLVYKLTDRTKLSLLGIGGIDRITIEPEPDIADYAPGETDSTDVAHVVNRTNQYVLGANLATVWNRHVLSNFIVSHSYNKFYIDFNRLDKVVTRPQNGDKLDLVSLPAGHHDVYDNSSVETTTDVKMNWTFLFGRKDALDFGAQAKFVAFDHQIAFLPFDSLNIVGGRAEPTVVSFRQTTTPKLGVYASYSKKFSAQLHANLGLRYDYFSLLHTNDWSPRASLSYAADDRLTISAAAGLFHQSPEFVYITGDPSNKANLRSIRSAHYIFGVSYLLREATLFSLELYRKSYSHYPVASDPEFAFYSTANSGGSYGSVGSEALVSAGSGKATGFEVLLQKKLVSRLYGLASYSHSIIEHRALDGILRPGEFDNRHVVNLVVGYRLDKSHELSLKWRYAGGRPYTPFDVNASRAAGLGIFDVASINANRFTPYHRLDLRYDYRKYFRKFTLVTYFSVENVYHRKNEAAIFWNAKRQETEFAYQTGFFPVGGFSLEF